MRAGKGLFFTVLVFLMVSPAGVFAQQGEAYTAQHLQTDSLLARWKSKDSPGLSVVILKGQQIVYKKSFGVADLEQHSAMTSQTVMNVASLSKQFTAFAIALLAKQGKISLSDDVHKYIPELPDYGHKISILHLITHTSGLKDQYDLVYLGGWGTDDVITNEDARQLIFRQKELNFEPGSQFMYCNSGYTLLSLIIERVSGQSYPEWMRMHIFAPLQMRHSFFLTDHRQVIPDVAESYSIAEDGYKKSIIQSTTYGPNGLHTTVDDLVKWVENYQKKTVGNNEVMSVISRVPDARLLSAGSNSKPIDLGYGFGQAFTTYRGQKLIWHDGYDAGFRSYIGRFPDQQFAVIISGNMELIDPKNMAMQLADIYLKRQLDPSTSPSVAPAVKNFAPESVEQAIEGYYRLGRDSLLYIYVIDHNIYGKFDNDKERLSIYPTSKTSFANDERKLAFKYIKNASRGDQVIFTMNNKPIPSLKVKQPDLSAYEGYKGNYYCPELDIYFRILIKGDQITIAQPRNRFITIKPIDKDHFGGAYWWLRDIKFIRTPENIISGFEINNGRAKHIVFRKVT